jgi:hypothetical protein
MKKTFLLLILLNLQNIYAQNEINFEVDMNHINQPNNTDYTNVVINGSWNNWIGWGVQLYDNNDDGVWTGQLVLDENINSFEYVIAITGPADNFSGWGQQFGEGCNENNFDFISQINVDIYDEIPILGCDLYVTNSNNNGPGSLRYVVQNSNAKINNIYFDESLINDTLLLNGDLELTSDYYNLIGSSNGNDYLNIITYNSSIIFKGIGLSVDKFYLRRFESESWVNKSMFAIETNPNYNFDITFNNTIIDNCSDNSTGIILLSGGNDLGKVFIDNSIVSNNTSSWTNNTLVRDSGGLSCSVFSCTNTIFDNNDEIFTSALNGYTIDNGMSSLDTIIENYENCTFKNSDYTLGSEYYDNLLGFDTYPNGYPYNEIHLTNCIFENDNQDSDVNIICDYWGSGTIQNCFFDNGGFVGLKNIKLINHSSFLGTGEYFGGYYRGVWLNTNNSNIDIYNSNFSSDLFIDQNGYYFGQDGLLDYSNLSDLSVKIDSSFFNSQLNIESNVVEVSNSIFENSDRGAFNIDEGLTTNTIYEPTAEVINCAVKNSTNTDWEESGTVLFPTIGKLSNPNAYISNCSFYDNYNVHAELRISGNNSNVHNCTFRTDSTSILVTGWVSFPGNPVAENNITNLYVTNSTLASGMYSIRTEVLVAANVYIKNSIIDSITSDIYYGLGVDYNEFTSNGYNIFRQDNLEFNNPTDIYGVQDFLLSPLGNYGGDQLTMPPLECSLALDAGDPNDEGLSQNLSYPVGEKDIGAAESDIEIVRFKCIDGDCQTVYDASGQYCTLEECEANCEVVIEESWSCIIDACVDPMDGSGEFSTLNDCEQECQNISTIEEQNFEFKVYPNPSRGEFNISFDLESRQDVHLIITNYLGEVVFTEELKDKEGQYNKIIDLGNKANGIYMLNITTNNQNINQKIVIQ